MQILQQFEFVINVFVCCVTQYMLSSTEILAIVEEIYKFKDLWKLIHVV